MKDFITASLILLLLFGGWLGFLYYSGQEIQKLTAEIQNNILPAIDSENWQESSKLMKDFQKRWDKLYRLSLYFRDTGPLNEINISIDRTIKYIQAEDRSNSSGELQAVRNQFETMSNQEKLSLQNIL